MMAAAQTLECGYADLEQLGLIQTALLRGLAAAWMGRATGEVFGRSPLVSDVKDELIDYVLDKPTQQQYVCSAGEEPSDKVDRMVQAFTRSKRNLLSKMSSKMGLLKQEKLDDVVEQFQKEGAWAPGQCESLARALLKSTDLNATRQCNQAFGTPEELAAHRSQCRFRPVNCQNLGCSEVLSAFRLASHDGTCPYKLLPCEQKCGCQVMRSEMVNHCLTTCPMKMLNCAFSALGCREPMPQGSLQQHYDTSVALHLMLMLRSQQRTQAEMVERISLLEKSVSLTQREDALATGSLSLTVKEQQAKIKKLEDELSRVKREQESKLRKLEDEVSKLRMYSTSPRGK